MTNNVEELNVPEVEGNGHTLNQATEFGISIWAGNCIIALDLKHPNNADTPDEFKKLFEIVEIFEDGAKLKVREYSKSGKVETPILVWSNHALRPAFACEVNSGIIVTNVGEYIDTIYKILTENNSIRMTFAEKQFKLIEQMHENRVNLNADGRNYYQSVVDELYNMVEEDYTKSSDVIGKLIREMRDALGTPRIEDCSVSLNIVSGLKPVLTHILTRFRLEGHSGSTYTSGAKHIIGTIRRVASRYGIDQEDFLEVNNVSINELLEAELSAYVDPEHPDLTHFEVLREWRKQGRAAFYPVFDFSYYPECAKHITTLDVTWLEPLALLLDYFLADGPSIIGYDLTQENTWGDKYLGGGTRHHFQNKIFGNVFKELDDATGEALIYVSGNIVLTDSTEKGVAINQTSNFTNYKSGRLLDASEPKLDPTNFKGITHVQAFQDKVTNEIVIPEKINIFGVPQEELDRILVQSCDPMNYYNIKSVSDEGIELEDWRTKQVHTISKEQFEEVRTTHGKVVKEIQYPAYHTWYKKEEKPA